MSFTLEQVRGFVAVAEEGNFSRAAERLMMTQPPLSRQVQKLERSLGVVLLRRTPRGTELTPAGRAFLSEARAILGQVDAAALTARRVSDGAEGSVRVGVTLVGAVNVLGRWVRTAQSVLPGVELMISEMVTGAQVQALVAAELDVGLLRGRPRPDVLETRLVHAERLVAAVPAGHPAAGDAPITLTDLAEHPLVGYEPSEARYFHELVVGSFRRAGLEPRYAQHVSQLTSMLALVRAGVGIAVVPESAAALGLAGVTCRPIEDISSGAVELYAAWRRDSPNPALGPLLRAVLPEPD